MVIEGYIQGRKEKERGEEGEEGLNKRSKKRAGEGYGNREEEAQSHQMDSGSLALLDFLLGFHGVGRSAAQ